MGKTINEGDPLRVLTNKPVEPMLVNVVWFVVSDGESPKHYSLGSAFVVNQVGDTEEEGFKHFAAGDGHVFQQPLPLNDLPWFPAFVKSAAHFSLGVQDVKEPEFIENLLGLAADDGYHLN